ncbi:hypothetical protein M434DRAFT_175951 [Hypoxylon sp. CO27-5]|nr:hypothetical protein M434DRAFT_175951 [Hypoxylon sp. CO27-5]
MCTNWNVFKERREMEGDASKQRFDTILDLLRFTQVDVRQQNVSLASPETCAWILGTTQYKSWAKLTEDSIDDRFLWIKGKPGAGKSTLMRFLYEKSSIQMPEAQKISFFFNARGDHLEKSTIGLYRALLWKILRIFNDLARVLVDVSVDSVKMSGWGEQHLQNLLRQAIEQFGDRPLVCYIDALDECPEDQVRDMIGYFQTILERTARSRCNFKICLSSRPYPNIAIVNSLILVLEGYYQHEQDIRRYIDSELINRVDRVDQGQAIRIQDEIVRKSSGVFLYVKLVIDMIKKTFDHGKANAHALERLLAKLPRGLNALYCDMLDRNPEDSEDPEDITAMRLCFQWVLFADRPLNVAELYYAIRFGLNDDIALRYDKSENLMKTMSRYILSVSKGFVEEIGESQTDYRWGRGTVQFIHASVRDFLLSIDGCQRVWNSSSGPFEGKAHDGLKQLCYKGLQFMACELERSGWRRGILPSDPVDHYLPWFQTVRRNIFYNRSSSSNDGDFNPILVYTIYGCFKHAEKAQSLGIQQQKFLSDFSIDVWIKVRNLIFLRDDERGDGNRSNRIIFNGFPPDTPAPIDNASQSDAKMLYILVVNNYPHLVRIYPGRDNHLKFDGGRDGPPLVAAILHGHREVARDLGIQVFLDQKLPISIDEEDEKYFDSLEPRRDIALFRNLLFTLITLDCVSALKVLAIREEDFNQISSSYTPLSCAMRYRSLKAINWLLANPTVNLNGLDGLGRTPFACAITTGYLKIAKVLFASGSVDVNSMDNQGRSPLSHAVKRRDVHAVEWLLSLDEVDPNIRDNNGRTPVSHVLEVSTSNVLEIFVKFGRGGIRSERDPGHTPKRARTDKRTSLEIDFDSRDDVGRTPLRWASEIPYNQTHQMVRMLLDTDTVNPELKASDGLTPLDAFKLQLGGEQDEIVRPCVEEIENYLCQKRRALNRVEYD